MKKTLIVTALLAVIALSIFAYHRMHHGGYAMHEAGKHNGMHHTQHKMQHGATAMPQRVGQAGFAAIAEIVQMLSDDPDTDWSTVNINALREHLLDMDRLVSGAVVDEQVIEGGMRFNVTGEDDVLTAIQAMVPAHAMELSKMDIFTASTENIENGIALTVTTTDEAAIQQIKGLGFFGLMATGSHHQQHHFMMATGQGHGHH